MALTMVVFGAQLDPCPVGGFQHKTVTRRVRMWSHNRADCHALSAASRSGPHNQPRVGSWDLLVSIAITPATALARSSCAPGGMIDDCRDRRARPALQSDHLSHQTCDHRAE